MIMNKIIKLITITLLILCLICIVGCGKKKDKDKEKDTSSASSILTDGNIEDIFGEDDYEVTSKDYENGYVDLIEGADEDTVDAAEIFGNTSNKNESVSKNESSKNTTTTSSDKSTSSNSNSENSSNNNSSKPEDEKTETTSNNIVDGKDTDNKGYSQGWIN